MLKIGLTGGIGSGKSVVANIFGILGVPVYYADTEAKRLMNTDEELKQTISRIFGPEAYVDRQLNRPYIAAKVFNHAGMLDQLNTAVHPAVHRDFLRWCNRHSDAPYVIEEAAILVESGGSKQFDVILVVNADEAVRIRRVKARDGITEEEIRSRMARQMKPENLNRYADYIITNNGTQLLVPGVLELHRKFVSLQVS